MSGNMGRAEWKKSDVEAKCPFLQYHTQTTIVCEGVIPGTNTRTIFKRESTKDKHYRLYCCGAYTVCELYAPIEDKYKGRDEK